jgi:hypothetical protein
MDEDETKLMNACADLVASRNNEAFPLLLLTKEQAGEWIPLSDFCSQIGLTAEALQPSVFATWLPDPMGNGDYVIIMFYDEESQWSMAAQYNRSRLLGGMASQQAAPNGTASEMPHVQSGEELKSTHG